MTKLTDGKRTVAIEMMVWQETGYSPDWSNDFFEVGGLPCHEDEQTGDMVYHVEDVDYCVEQAQEWADEDENNAVFVEEATKIDRDMFELMVADWLTDNAEEMAGLRLTGEPYIDDEGRWVQPAADDDHVYTLHATDDGDIYIVD